jgi:hypothetical protein
MGISAELQASVDCGMSQDPFWLRKGDQLRTTSGAKSGLKMVNRGLIAKSGQLTIRTVGQTL